MPHRSPVVRVRPASRHNRMETGHPSSQKFRRMRLPASDIALMANVADVVTRIAAGPCPGTSDSAYAVTRA
ncbi:MAG: hypothetical protein DMF78_24370 [Acidobacteria bacterium]|nr:MAG: hypothetical protein DMF78_24370 [Acidobacteriota bacterium]